MSFKSQNEDDADSGLENTSESSHSGDEDGIFLSARNEDETKSENKSNSSDSNVINKRSSKFCILNDSNFSSSALDFQYDSKVSLNENLHKNGAESEQNPPHDVLIKPNNGNLVLDEYHDVLKFFKTLAESQCQTVDFSINSSSRKPEWLDENKFKRGQKFARDHLFCINFSEMLSLFILFAQKSSLGPLIFTGKSDSPFTAFKRYLNTMTKLLSWYKDDIWCEEECEGKTNLNIVRRMHKSVYEKLSNESQKNLSEKTTLGDPKTTTLWCPLRDLLIDDFRESLPSHYQFFEEYLNLKKVWVNQADMSMTQFGFVGLAVTYPEYFGIYLASDEDLEAFLHLWRGLGYLLGIKDEYNFCNGNLKTVRLRTKFYLETIAKPGFRNASYDWEHMCRCLTTGISFYIPQVNFESCLLYLCHVLNINTPRLRKQISFRAYIIFQVHRLIFYLMKFSRVLKWLNFRLYKAIRKAQSAPQDVLKEWECRKFSYMNQEGKRLIRQY